MGRRTLGGPQLGSLIGAVAGLLFMLINAGDTGAAVPIRVVGVVLVAAALIWGVFRSPLLRSTELSPEAGRTYRLSVIAEVVAIPVGAMVINNVFDRPDLTVLWVVAVVGLHFLPFSKAFRTPIYAWLGAAMIVLATVGCIVTLASGSDSSPAWFAVGAGVVLLGFSTAGPHLTSRDVSPQGPTGTPGPPLDR